MDAHPSLSKHFMAMRSPRRIACLILMLLCGLATPSRGGPKPEAGKSAYTEAMFRKAFENTSTAPDFILVTIRDGRTGEQSTRCIESNFLLGSIHKENGIDYDEAGTARVLAIALKHFQEPVTLMNREALKNVLPRYTPEQLAAARKVLGEASAAQLKGRGFIDKLCNGSAPQLEREAAAHVLLEHGIRCGRGCMTGGLWTGETTLTEGKS